MSAWFLGALGAIAVGVSGLVAAAMRLAGMSNETLAGRPSASGLTAADCARWLSSYRHATTCVQAATADWASETVAYRIAFGLLGLVALGGLRLARRRWVGLKVKTLPTLVGDTVATVAFVASGVWLTGMGIDALIVGSGRSAGQWLSAAPVALAGGIYFGLRLAQQINTSSSHLTQLTP